MSKYTNMYRCITINCHSDSVLMDSISSHSLYSNGVTSFLGEGKGHCCIKGHKWLQNKETIYVILSCFSGAMLWRWINRAYLCLIIKPPEIRDCSHTTGAKCCCEIHCFVLDDHQRSWKLHLLELTFKENTHKVWSHTFY